MLLSRFFFGIMRFSAVEIATKKTVDESTPPTDMVDGVDLRETNHISGSGDKLQTQELRSSITHFGTRQVIERLLNSLIVPV